MRFSFCMPGNDMLFKSKEPVSMLSYYEKCREAAEKIGLDAFESNVGNIIRLSDEETDILADRYPNGSLNLYACCGLLPDMPNIVTADSEEKNRLLRHIDKTTSRLGMLGTKRLVFGSGWNRKIPDGFDAEMAQNIIYDFIRYTASRCKENGIVLVLEPLNRDETNWCNTVAQGAEIVRELNMPSFRLLADGYHMYREAEDVSVLEKNSDILFHCHVASENRRCPGTTEYEKRFLRELIRIGYDGVISVECGLSDFYTEASETLEFMKSI